MRLVVNIQSGNLTDVEEVAPGQFRARMQPESNSVYPYPTHQLCWFICRFEGVPANGAPAQLTLVNCEWNPDGFRSQRPFICYDSDWQRSPHWTHTGLTGVQLDSTRSESARTRPAPPIATTAALPSANTPPANSATNESRHPGAATDSGVALAAPAAPATEPAPAKKSATPRRKDETKTLRLFPADDETTEPAQPPAQPSAPTRDKPSDPAPNASPHLSATPASAPAPATATEITTTAATSDIAAATTPDFTGGTVTYRFHLRSDCTVALHPPYTHELCHADLERWGLSAHLHYQRLGASHGGKSFFVVEAARHRAKGVNPALPFVVLLAREHGVEPAVNWVVRGMLDRLLNDPALHTLDRLSLILFPFVNQDGAYQGMTVDPHTGMDVGNDFGRSPVAVANPNSAPGAAQLPEFKLPESRMIYRYIADQLRAGRRCLGAVSLHQPHGGRENIWPVYYLGPGRHCLDTALTAFQRALHHHTRHFTHAAPDFWPSRISVGRLDQDFGIPAVTLEINPHCPRNPLGVPDLERLGGNLAQALGAWAENA